MLRKVIFIGICVFLLTSAASYWIYRAAISGPKFYRELISEDQSDARQLGSQLESTVLELHNAAVRENEWSLEVTDDEINAWLVDHLPRKYPRQNPDSIVDPRVKIADGEIKFAFRAKSTSFPVVVCVHVEPFVTSDGNNIGLCITKSYVGLLPLGKKRVVEQLSSAAAKIKIPIAWSQDKNGPVAMLSPQIKLAKEVERKIEITSIKISGASLMLSGTASDSTD